MTVESHLPLGGETESQQDETEFEPAKPRRKSRRERRPERTRVHEHVPVLGPHTIWTREDPNHLQPLETDIPAPEHASAAPNTVVAAHGELKTAKSAEHTHDHGRKEHAVEASRDTKPVSKKQHEEKVRSEAPAPDITSIIPPETTMPAPQKRESAARKDPQPESLAELLKLQELPKLNIQRRNFYTEPEVRQPNATETEHDILPSTRQEGQPADSIANQEQMQPAAGEASGSIEYLHTGEQLQHRAEETARRAAELADKDAQRRTTAAPEMPSAMEGRRSAANEIDVHLGQADLLVLGDSIRVDGISVSEMFRAGRLDEDGLRRIVAAFLRGYDAQRIVAEEVLRVQMKFERDPQLRSTRVAGRPDTAKRSTSRARTQAKKVLDPKRAMYHADHLADRLASGLDRIAESAEGQPNIGKTIGITLAVIIYFIILILIIKS